MTGPIKYLNYELQVHAMAWYVCNLTLIHTILPAEYYFRYFALSNQQFLTKLQTFGLYIIAMMISFPMYISSYMAYRYSGLSQPDFNYGLLWYDTDTVPQLIIGDIRNFWMKCYFLMAILFVGGSYVAAICIGVATFKKLKTPSIHLVPKTKQLHRQLTTVLLVQVHL